MELKLGYKQTDVGVIPEDWEVKRIIECADYVDYRGKTPTKTLSGILLVTAKNIRAGFIDYEVSQEYIAESEYDSAMRRGKPCIGDVLITTEAPLGMVALVDRDDIALAQRVIKYRGKSSKVYSRFLKHYFLSPKFQAILDENSSGSTAKGIKGSVLHQLPVIVPPLAEQEAIAEALSDADALIEALAQLIAKKRQIKQGAMQELLTGKKRLPGFATKLGYKQTEVGVLPEDWNFEYIENLAYITTGGSNTQDRVDDGQYPFFVRSQTIERINSYSYDGEAVLTAGDGVGTGKVFHYINGKFDAHQRVYRISEFNEHINGYFFYLYFSNYFYKRIMQMTAKSSVDSVRREMIARMLVPLPPTLTEQTAIAAILSDMDAEIAALETKLAKARQVKQGMMQELLTGRIRLV